MDPSFWHQRWQSSQIGFHLPAPNPRLVEHWPALGVPVEHEVFVPLCGKTVDMRWLAARGHRVRGVELSPLAAEAFFAEAGETPTRTADGAHTRHEAGPIVLLEGDVFEVDHALDAIYDRAALIALPPDLRARYAAHLTRLARPGARMLLVTLAWPEGQRQGPPFAVSDELVEHYYGDTWELTRVHEADLKAAEPARFADVPWARETTFHLVRRPVAPGGVAR